jgi:TetR/AcrR family transcriptional regulator, regulator of cefoperazone and chloramphenicol sensitivity
VKRRQPDDQATRRRLLDVATRHFTSLGYKHVTIRGICREAHANVAAVNYHFGDKMGLYREVLDSAFAVVRETTARAIAAGEGQPPEGKLRSYIKVHAEAILAATGPSALQQLIHREMDQLTSGVNTLIERTIRPRFEYLFGVVGELLELPPDDERVRLAALGIHGLILMFRPTPLAQRVGAQLNLNFSTEAIVEHLMTFSVAGLDAYRPAKGRRRPTGNSSRD